jgi:xylan 1,4-beta-xylosidase
MVARDCGFKYVRGHGLLDDDVGISFAPGVNSWFNLFSLVDYQLSVGVLPFFEVSYFPTWLSGDNCTRRVMGYGGCVTPPPDLGQWSDLLAEMGSALIARYGEEQTSEFRFEIWNELDGLNSSQYNAIYAAAARGLKRASASLKVGGPATSCGNGWDEPNHPQLGRLFLESVRNDSVPIDFFSSHVYANKKWTGWTGRASAVVQGVLNATTLMDEFGLNDLPYYNTEFGTTSSQGDGSVDKPNTDLHDTNEQASFIVATVDQLTSAVREDPRFRLPTTLSYWTFSDIMNEENSASQYGQISRAPGWQTNASFHGGFGLVNAFGVPKPSFRAYQLLHQAHEFQQPVTRTSAKPVASTGESGVMGGPDALCALTTGVIATTSAANASTKSRSLQLLLYNHREWDAPDLGHPNPSVPCEVTVVLGGGGGAMTAAARRIIDIDHANPRGRWIELGMPAYPSPAEHAEILAASELVSQPVVLVPVSGSPDKRALKILLTKHSVIAVDLLIANPQ